MKDRIEGIDVNMGDLKEKYEKEKKELSDKLLEKLRKKEELEKQVESLRRDLERLNTNRNTLYTAIGNDERLLKERENEKNKLIN
jgi:hypothetical protein